MIYKSQTICFKSPDNCGANKLFLTLVSTSYPYFAIIRSSFFEVRVIWNRYNASEEVRFGMFQVIFATGIYLWGMSSFILVTSLNGAIWLRALRSLGTLFGLGDDVFCIFDITYFYCWPFTWDYWSEGALNVFTVVCLFTTRIEYITRKKIKKFVYISDKK